MMQSTDRITPNQSADTDRLGGLDWLPLAVAIIMAGCAVASFVIGPLVRQALDLIAALPPV